MMDYVIMTDSSCDMTQEMADQLELKVLSLSVITPQGEFFNDLDWSAISGNAFYARLRAGDVCKTAAVNSETFKKAFREILDTGKNVLYLGFSSGLSTTYNSSMLAAKELQEAYPERKIYTVDTLCASLGQGLMVYLAAKKRQSGATIEEVRDYVEENKLHLCHWFTVDDLQFLRRGGRVSSAAAVIGTMLQIKPVLHVDNEGKLIPMDKVRGRKASLNALADRMAQSAIAPVDQQTVFISHGDCLADAEYLRDRVKQKMGVKDIQINLIGPVIGSHSGPGTVALFFLGTQR